MFSGIIETIGIVKSLQKQGSNLTIQIESSISKDLKIDQSVSHNGVCLTVEDMEWDIHTVTAVQETIERSNLGNLQIGDRINLERSLKVDDRIDGHFVQGHVDTVAKCLSIEDLDGSRYYTFGFQPIDEVVLVDKGSISVNGVSLTIIKPGNNQFKVAIIPFTFEHTNFSDLQKGSVVNIEFDILGKYFARFFKGFRQKLKNN